MTHYIYIPGLGDGYDPLRRLALRRWKSAHTTVTLVPMRWNDRKETYEQRYVRIVEAIKAAESEDIVLVGESAGGAMALYTFSRQRKRVKELVTICGYNHGAESVHAIHKLRHPAFYFLMPEVDKIVASLDVATLSHITTIYSTRDEVVAPVYSRIKGAKEIVLHARGHLTNITRALLGRFPIIRDQLL